LQLLDGFSVNNLFSINNLHVTTVWHGVASILYGVGQHCVTFEAPEFRPACARWRAIPKATVSPPQPHLP
jgi:hypothetical protein